VRCLICSKPGAMLCENEECSRDVAPPEKLAMLDLARENAEKHRRALEAVTVRQARQWVNPEDIIWSWGEGRV
jgi:hypothetical protein